MAWVKPTVDDLAQTLSLRELDAFRKDGSLDGRDPVESLVATTVAAVRGFVFANGAVALSPDAGEIPASLLQSAMDYAAYQVLKRRPVPVDEDRRKAYDDARNLFQRIAAGETRCEPYGEEPSGGSAKATAPLSAAPRPQRLLD